jgi:hypothetical protein
MIAPRSLAAALTDGGRYALDVPVAALAGLSVAFLAFAVPGDTLAEIMGSTGLASVIPAAEPPFGLKARLGIGAAGAVAVFAAAFMFLRWLDRLGTRSAENGEPVEREAPRLRRRDLHPDAPPRPPIMATYEFGEPEYARPSAVELRKPAAPEAQDEWLLDEPVPFDAPEPEPLSPPAQEPTAKAADPVPLPVDAPAPAGNLDALMARLEEGLARRRIGAVPPAMPAEPLVPPESTPFPEAADDRLQSAIDSLQRLAARGD